MMHLDEIERKLRALLRPEHPSRPFLCAGSPIGCQLAIVGINPATDIPLWPFWNTESGCNKEGWLAAFRRDPKNARKQTRPRIELLLAEIAPVRCLELNIYPYISPDEAALPDELRDLSVFNYLLSTVKPRLLFVFGKTPRKELKNLLEVQSLANGIYTSCTYEGTSFEVYADSHLSRGWSEDRVRAVGRSLRNRLMGRNG
jgi:hypothetical protein